MAKGNITGRISVSVPNERIDLFLDRLTSLLPQLEDDELVGAYNVVRWLPAALADEAWELVDAELRKRDIAVPGTAAVGASDPAVVLRAPRCENCDAEAALIYDTCGHGS